MKTASAILAFGLVALTSAAPYSMSMPAGGYHPSKPAPKACVRPSKPQGYPVPPPPPAYTPSPAPEAYTPTPQAGYPAPEASYPGTPQASYPGTPEASYPATPEASYPATPVSSYAPPASTYAPGPSDTPAPPAPPPPPPAPAQLNGNFTLIAHAAGSPVDNQPIQANNGKFYIGKPATCKSKHNAPKCPDSPNTIYTSNAADIGPINLLKLVDGTQRMYADKVSKHDAKAELRFTDKDGKLPNNANTDFQLKDNNLLMTNQGWPFVACESHDAHQVYAIWNQVNVPEKCVKITISYNKVEGDAAVPQVWEYDD